MFLAQALTQTTQIHVCYLSNNKATIKKRTQKAKNELFDMETAIGYTYVTNRGHMCGLMQYPLEKLCHLHGFWICLHFLTLQHAIHMLPKW